MHFLGNVEAVLAVLDTDEIHDPGLFHWAQIDLSLTGCTGERLCCSVACAEKVSECCRSSKAVYFIHWIALWM